MKPILAATLAVATFASVAEAGADPAIAWSTPIGVDATTWARGTYVPSIRGGLALLSGTATQSAQAHVAVDVATGNVRWTQVMDGGGGSLLGPDGSAYVSGYVSERGNLLTRISNTGARQWTITSPEDVSLVPRVSDATGVYAVDYPVENARIFRIDAADGHAVWSVGTPELGGTRESLNDIASVNGDLLVLHLQVEPEYRYFLSRFAAADGARMWQVPLAQSGDTNVYSTQAFRVSPDGSTLYWLGSNYDQAGGRLCWLARYELASGQRTSRVALTGPLAMACNNNGSASPGLAAFAADGDLLTIVPGSSTGTIFRLDGVTGSQRWARPTDLVGRIIVGDDGRVLATNYRYSDFYILDATASLLAADTGAVLNRFTLPITGYPGETSISAAFLPGNETWVATSGGTSPVHQSRRSASGAENWSRDVSPAFVAPMDGYAVMSGPAHAVLTAWLVDPLYANVLRLPLVAMQRIDRTTGAVNWRVLEEGSYGNAQVGFREHVSGDTIETTSFFAGGSQDRSRVFRFDEASGVPTWTASVVAPAMYVSAEPIDAQTIVAFGYSDPYSGAPNWIMHGRDAASGAQTWSVSRPARDGRMTVYGRDGLAFVVELATSPVVSAIERIDPMTGATNWRHEYDSVSPVVPVQAAAGGDVFIAYARNGAGGRKEVVAQRLARATGAVQWTTVLVPAIASDEDTPTLRVASGVVDVLTRRARAGDEWSAVTRLSQSDGAITWSRELPKLAKGTELAQQTRTMPDGTLAIVRSVGLRDAGARWLRGSLLDRIDATTGAFVSTHVLSLATDEHSRDVGAYPPSWIVGAVDADNFLVYDYGVANDNGRTQRMSRFNVPATFATGDARTTVATSSFVDDGRMRGYDFDVSTAYVGDALPAPITLHLDTTRALASIAWTCSVAGGGSCSPASGTGAARIALTLSPGATANVHGTLRTPLGGALVAGVRAYAALPFAVGEATPTDNAASAGMRLELLGNSFE